MTPPDLVASQDIELKTAERRLPIRSAVSVFDVSGKSRNQVSRAASALGFLASIARARGLTPNEWHSL